MTTPNQTALVALKAVVQQFDNVDRHTARQKIAYDMAVEAITALTAEASAGDDLPGAPGPHAILRGLADFATRSDYDGKVMRDRIYTVLKMIPPDDLGALSPTPDAAAVRDALDWLNNTTWSNTHGDNRDGDKMLSVIIRAALTNSVPQEVVERVAGALERINARQWAERAVVDEHSFAVLEDIGNVATEALALLSPHLKKDGG